MNKQTKAHLVKILHTLDKVQTLLTAGKEKLQKTDLRERVAKTQQQTAYSMQQNPILRCQALDNIYYHFLIKPLLSGTENRLY